MPFITFEAAELPAEVKKELIKKLTNVSAEVTGIPKEAFSIKILEYPAENIAVGGVTVKEIREKRGIK